MKLKNKIIAELTDKELVQKLEKLEEKYDQQFKVVFALLKKCSRPPRRLRKR